MENRINKNLAAAIETMRNACDNAERRTKDGGERAIQGVLHALSYQMARHFNVPLKGVYVANPGYVLGAAGVPRMITDLATGCGRTRQGWSAATFSPRTTRSPSALTSRRWVCRAFRPLSCTTNPNSTRCCARSAPRAAPTPGGAARSPTSSTTATVA